MKKIKTVLVIANKDKEDCHEVLRRLEGYCHRYGIEFRSEPETDGMDKDSKAGKKLVRGYDAVITLGGDGTVLRAIRDFAGSEIPIMGINLGGLGFLTSIGVNEIEGAVEDLAKGRYKICEHSRVRCSIIRNGKRVGTYDALNEALVRNGELSRVVVLELIIDGEIISSYVCDGIMVATPTGSTGHSLSAGGPIVRPDMCALIITFLCPHALSARPIVLPERSVVELGIVKSSGIGILSIDGQVNFELQNDDKVIFVKSPGRVKFIRLLNYSYFTVLRQKLGWKGR